MKQFDQELVSGSVPRSVWKMAWPIVLAHLIAGSHGFVDQMLVGNYVEGVAANAGIGAAWQVFLIVIVFIASLFHGMGILIARYAGQQDRASVNRTGFSVFIVCAYILIFIVAPLGYFASPYVIKFTRITPEVEEHALPYLRIMSTMSAPLFAMFLLNGAFLATGTPKIALLLNTVTTLTNIAISYVLITGAGPFPQMGTAGAALGTCLGPIPSLALALYIIATGRSVIGLPDRMSLKPDWPVLKEVARVGLPTGIQGVLLNVAGVFLLRFIGALENATETFAAYTICYTQLFAFVTWAGFGIRNASATLIGQNLGAGKPERGQRVVYIAASLGLIWALLWGVLYWNVPNLLLGLFGANHGLTLEIGSRFLRYLTFSGVFLATNMAFTGGLQGAGDTKKPMFIAFISQIVILLGVCFAFQALGRLTDTAIWTAILCAHASRLVMTVAVFRRGAWKTIQVGIKDIEEPLTDDVAAPTVAEAEEPNV